MKGLMAAGRNAWRVLGSVLAAALLLAGCDGATAPAAYTPTLAPAPAARSGIVEYKFGVTPMSNFRNVYDVFQPIVDYLNARLPDARLVLEVPRGLAEHDEQLRRRQFAFALSNPWHTWSAVQRGDYLIVAKIADDDAFRGIWIVRKDSGIGQLADFKGKDVSFPPKSALAATMMTRLQLKQAGVDPERDIRANYVGSQHASIMQVYTRGAAAGATWPLAWKTFQRLHPAEANELEARYPTAPLVNQGIAARKDVPPELARRVAHLMAAMHESQEGRALLAAVPVERFALSGAADYAVVETFMGKYRAVFPNIGE